MAAQTSDSPSNRQGSEQQQKMDEEEVEEVQSSRVMTCLTRVSERVASTAIGQYAIRKLDNILWTVEKSAKWSLPQYTRLSSPAKEKEEQEKIQEPPLTRPLPWIFFIPMLVALRMIRTGLSLVALVLRKGPVTPAMMVSFSHVNRCIDGTFHNFCSARSISSKVEDENCAL